MCGLARSLLEKKGSFVTGRAEVSNGQKIDCWRGLYSSHAERYANVAGVVDTPLRAVHPNIMGEFAFDLRRFKGILVGFPSSR